MSIWSGIKSLFTGSYSRAESITSQDVDRVSEGGAYPKMPDLSALWDSYSDAQLINLFHSYAEVFAPVHLIAFCVAHANFQVKRVKDDSVVFDNKYMNKLLSTPNPLQNFTELVYQKEVYELITGKSFLYANVPESYPVNYRNAATLVNRAADQVQVRTALQIKILSATTIEDLILDYCVPDGSTGTVPIAPKYVMYSKYASMVAMDMNILGKSPLMSGKYVLSNLKAVTEARNVIYTKRGALGIIVSKKSDADGQVALSPKEREQLHADFNRYGLTGNKSPFSVTNLPVDYIQVAMSIADLQPFEETEYCAAAIYAVYNVPRELLPRQKGATFENQKAAKKALYEDVIIPRANSLAQSLTSFLKLEDVDLYLSADFSHIKVLQEDLKEKSDVDFKNNETYKSRFLNGQMTLNAWGAAIGNEEVKNSLYSKLIYDMSDEELLKVEQIMKMSVAKAPNNQNNPQDGNK